VGLLETPALLVGSAVVAALGALLKAAGHQVAVRVRVVVVVFELGGDVLDVQAQPADASEHPSVGGLPDRYRSVVTFGLEVGELAAEQVGLMFRVVDDLGSAGELHGGVAAGGHAVLVGAAGLGAPGARHVGVVVDHGQQDGGLSMQGWPDGVGSGQVHQQRRVLDGEVGGYR